MAMGSYNIDLAMTMAATVAGTPQNFPGGAGVFRPPPGLPAPPIFEAAMPAYPMPLRHLDSPAKVSNKDTMKPSLNLIWCHEFCHHADNKERRQLIKKSFAEKDYSIHYLKKAVLFSKWLEEADACEEYLLVMGWREAQPCLRYIASSGAKAPMMSIIICDGMKQYTRASNYVLTLSDSVGPVQVCLQDNIPSSLHAGLIRECFGSLAPEEQVAPPVTPPKQQRKISLMDELAKLPSNLAASDASTGSGSGCTTPSEGDCASSCDGSLYQSHSSHIVNLHQAFVAALERCESGTSSSETPSAFVTTPAVTRRSGKGKGNGSPVAATLSMLVAP